MAVVPVVWSQLKSICRLALQTIRARRMVWATRPWASRLLRSAMLIPWLFEPCVDPFDVRPFGPVGVLPAGVEVVPVLAELVELAEVAGPDRDRRLLADPRQFLLGQGSQASAWGVGTVGLAAMCAAVARRLVRSTVAGRGAGIWWTWLKRGQATAGEGPLAGHWSRIAPRSSADSLRRR